MWTIQNADLTISLHDPSDGFYLGTRFDRGGVFDGILFRGTQMCGRWFERYDPHMHDAVCGPAEEFAPVGFERAAAGGTFLKIGVGLLERPDDASYDRFRLYRIADPGEWTVDQAPGSVSFRHVLDAYYDYRKVISLSGGRGLRISHELNVLQPLVTEVYNHNFFTMGRLCVGPTRRLDFPFAPQGTWRAAYDSVDFASSGIRFYRDLAPGESVYSGDVHAQGASGMPYSLTLGEGPLSVNIRGDVPVTRTVFWANHRIACLEPYNDVRAVPGEPFVWTIEYEFGYE